MDRVDITIEICGMSGDGTIAAGGLLNEAMSGAGFSVLAFDSYPAEIRGFGRCVTRSRFGHKEQVALEAATQVLISLDDEQSLSRLPSLTKDAVVIFDNKPPSQVPEDYSIAAHVAPTMRLCGVPFRDLASAAAGSDRGRNLTALGALAAIYQLPPKVFQDVIAKKFKSKGDRVVDHNIKSFDAGLEYARREFAGRLPQALVPPETAAGPEKVLLSGNVAIAEGALAAGIKNYFGYPITPATPIMEYLAGKLPERGGRVYQMEDEIASIGAVLGSFFASTRAMTATSGPGFALMAELITHGVMSETPAVIIDAQRGGPATGLPTKTEQADLLAAVFGGPGDSPRIVIAPTNVSECYHYTVKSFQLAEKYQTPVIVLTDFYLDNRVESVIRPQASPEETADGNIYPDESVREAYKRYQITESGISPRAVPGMEGYLFAATGLEHSEKGIPNYAPENHMNMSLKRLHKIQASLADLEEPVIYAGAEDLDLGVIGWGSTFGSVLEAVNSAQDLGLKVGALKITSIYPYHAGVIHGFMKRCREILIPELNLEGQLATLIEHLFHQDVVRLNMVTGVPIYPSTILNRIKEIIAGLNQ
ncbi:MAG: 2-oxoacid:acceptor oxidoreductase subunit alpha [Pseudomonadota bacterium]